MAALSDPGQALHSQALALLVAAFGAGCGGSGSVDVCEATSTGPSAAPVPTGDEC